MNLQIVFAGQKIFFSTFDLALINLTLIALGMLLFHYLQVAKSVSEGIWHFPQTLLHILFLECFKYTKFCMYNGLLLILIGIQAPLNHLKPKPFL
jgi:hypothetical protein